MTALLRVPGLRLLRRRRAWVALLCWVALGLVSARLALQTLGPHAADRAASTFGGAILPLVVLSVSSGALGGAELRKSIAPFVAFGARPLRVLSGLLFVACTASMLVAAAVAFGTALLAHDPQGLPLARELSAFSTAAALGAAVYAPLFVFGASFGPRGAGSFALLAVDFFLGEGTGAGALLVPRAHVRNLLGGAPPLDLPQLASAGVLLVLGLFYVGLCAARSRRME